MKQKLIITTAFAVLMIAGIASGVSALDSVSVGFNADSTLGAKQIMRYSAGMYDPEGGVTEIVTYSHAAKTAYVVNGKEGIISAIDLRSLKADSMTTTNAVDYDAAAIVAASGFVYGDVTSVSVSPNGTKLAAAVQHADYNTPGLVLVFSIDAAGALALDASYPTGVQPDMVVFADDNTVLTADEGEPRESYDAGAVDPRGSVTLINLSAFSAKKSTVLDFAQFDAQRAALLNADVVMKKGAQPSRDFEPEYIAVSGGNAYITMQEANSAAVLDIASRRFIGVYPLGVVDHSKTAIDLDSNDEASPVYNPKTYPNTYGLRLADGIAAYQVNGKNYIVTANEGDSREWGDYINEAEYIIAASDGSEIAKEARFLSTDYEGQRGLGDGSVNYLFGGRSFSIFEVTANGLNLVYDSGSEFESRSAAYLPDYFNASNDDAEKDSRSNKKGPEPESVTIGAIDGKTYAFVTLERIGGVMIYDITKPEAASFVQYINSRDFVNFFDNNEDGIGFDNSAEGLYFIPAASSPTGTPLLLAAFEVSGDVAAYSLK